MSENMNFQNISFWVFILYLTGILFSCPAAASTVNNPDSLKSIQSAEPVHVTYTYNPQGRLTQAAYSTGLVITYEYDPNGNILSVQTTMNYPPSAFERTEPVDSSTVVADTLRFDWTPAQDPEGKEISYNLTVSAGGSDTLITTQDITASVLFNRSSDDPDIDVNWSVLATDGIVSIPPSNGDGFFIWSEIGTNAESYKIMPDKFNLVQNYPNPFSSFTKIGYYLPEKSKIIIAVYNIAGQKIKQLVDELQSAGTYESSWDFSNFNPGIYFYTMQAKTVSGDVQFNSTKKMILIK
jgi:YD repeat-containing protein